MSATILERLSQKFIGDVDNPLSVNMPTTVNAGEMLIMVVSLGENREFAPPSGWHELLVSTPGSNENMIYQRDSAGAGDGTGVADGTEGGTTVDIPLTSPSRAVVHTFRISGASAVELQSTDYGLGVTSTPDIPALTPTWGAKDTLWLIGLLSRNQTQLPITFPTNYTTNGLAEQDGDSASGSTAVLATSYRSNNAASEDPSAFTCSGAYDSTAFILGIEPSAPSDTTAPTPGGSGTLASSNLSSTGFDVTFTKATDDISAQTALVYKLYTSDDLPLTTDPATVEANGTLQDTQTDVASLSATGLTHGTQYKANIIVEDEAGNKAIYSQLTVTTPFIYGTITEGGNPVQGAAVWIYTIDSDMSNKTLVESVTTDANGDYAMQSAYDTTKQYFVEVGYFKQVVSGTIDSVPGINYITDTGNFVGQDFSNGQYLFRTTGGTNAGKIYRVIGNTDDGISITPSVAQQFDNTTTYEVGQWYSDEATLIPRRS